MIDNAIIVEIDFPNEIDVDLGEAKFITAPAKQVPQATPEIHISESGLITASATQEEGMVLAGTKSAEFQMPTKISAIIEPSKETQVAIRKGEYAVGDISVNPISDEYIKPSGTIEITENNKEYDVANFEKANVNISGSQENKFAQLVDGSITEVTEADLQGTTKINSYGFYRCTALIEVNIPNNITSIGDNAFNGCTKLTNITISDTVTSIQAQTFNGCAAITSVTIPNSVTKIYSHAFNGCRALKNVIISKKIADILTNAFNNCINLEKVKIYAVNPPRIATNTFQAAPATCRFEVPASSVEAYKSATNWSTYADQIFAIEE